MENLGHSARAMAMASAFTSAEGDLSCLYWNPAGLDGIPSPELSLLHQDWISGMAQETLAMALPTEKAGTFALGLNALNYGTLDSYDSNGTLTGYEHPYRATFSFGWGGTLLHSLSIGLSSKSIYQSFAADDSGFSTALTAGVIWRALASLRIGAFYTFLNEGYPPQQGILKIGETWAFSLIPHNPTLFLLDFALPPDGVYLIQTGFEQPLFSFFFARLGYQQELRDNQIGGFRGLTGGFGFEIEEFDLDYAFIPEGNLGSTQMLGLTYHFPSDKPKTPAPPPSPAPTPSSQVSFKPPAELNPADRVVQVEVHFELPNGPASSAAPPTPDLEKRLELAGQRVQTKPKDAAAWVDLGNLYWKVDRPEYTVQCFEEALKLNPANRELGAWLERYRNLDKNPIK
ncbi:MAG TPA: hypothetical protein VMV05_12180 [bacterium]|nr:hypothetical protein [bacterium]